MNGFFYYIGHIFFEGFKCSFFTNFYTRMLLNEPSYDDEGEVNEEAKDVIKPGVKKLYIFELCLIWCLIAGLFLYYYKVT